MKKFIVQGAFLFALSAFAAAQTTPTTTPSNTNSTGTQNPTQVTPVPNPNAPPPPDANTNPTNQTGTATATGSANPDPSTNKSGDADQTTTTTPPTTTSAQDQTTTTTTASQTATRARNRDHAKLTAIVGCLESANNGQFTIRTAKNDVAVAPSRTFTGTFAEHVGHKVRVHGTYAATETAMNADTSGKLPQSDQPASANGTVQNDNPAKADTRPDTRAGATSADANASAKTSASTHEFRADSIDMLAKTCGNNNYNKK